jgi:hypothetical protein
VVGRHVVGESFCAAQSRGLLRSGCISASHRCHELPEDVAETTITWCLSIMERYIVASPDRVDMVKLGDVPDVLQIIRTNQVFASKACRQHGGCPSSLVSKSLFNHPTAASIKKRRSTLLYS